jgi:hypothetical protein
MNPLGHKKLGNLFGATQYKNVFNQLNIGIRMIDIRFCLYKGNDWRICHGNFGPYLNDILGQVTRFLTLAGNEKEIVIVKIRNFDDGASYESWKVGTQKAEDFLTKVEGLLNGHINSDWTIDSSLEQIVNSGRRALLIGGKLAKRPYLKTVKIGGEDKDIIVSSYPNKDNFGELKSVLTNEYNSDLKKEFGKRLTMVEYQLTMGAGVETLKHYGSLQSTRQFSRKINMQMKDLILNSLDRCRACNFISSDVVEENQSIQLSIDLSLERAQSTKDQLQSNGFSTLTVGKNLVSSNKIFNFIVQGDGNLVMYKNGQAKWASHTRGSNCNLVLQGDGNLVLYCNEGVRWATHTSHLASQGPFKFIVQNDGNLVLYTSRGAAWASNTAGVVTLAEDLENDPESYEGETLDEAPQSEQEEEF